ncbi:carbohydrate kinase family protein [Curtobacterium luteum]|uniref:carbohydrate kinase family protein n=1 Tax=Curtobacterium luteum TaxID=33881 RepID=UPI001665338C|nr:PfkB family carbohydrate kinase [Curtobacterium luteum]
MSTSHEHVVPPSAPASTRALPADRGRRRGVGKRFLVVGDVLDGILVHTTASAMGVHDPAATIRHRALGAGGNTATWLGWLGAEVDLVARTGVDDVYRHERGLEDAGVRPHIRYDARASTGTEVSVRNALGRTAMSDPAASGVLSAADVPPDLVARADIVHLTGAGLLTGGGAERVAELVACARAGGARVSLDPSSVAVVHTLGPAALLEALTGVDVLFPGRDEALALTETTDLRVAVRRLTEHVPLVVVTVGPEGAVLGRPGRSPQRVAATPATVVDTLGAGDAFAAGFLRAWATDPVRIGSAAREGGRVAARALGFVGGRPPA